jgi:threonine dehydrogenase-like Zn-dependent dehydrogenase
MKAIGVTPSDRKIQLLANHPEPVLSAPDHVKLRMLEVGVCGTDKEICAFLYGTPPAGSGYLVLGHESLGEVVEVGKGVTRVKVGDLVVPTVRRPCSDPSCASCLHDRQDFCFTGGFTERGIKEAHGYMTELVVDREKYMNPVPRDLREVAVLVEPLTIAEKALIQVWDVQARLPWTPAAGRGQGHRAVVLGAGPVGLLGAMALVRRGFTTFVASLEPLESPNASVARAIGATYLSTSSLPLRDLPGKVGNIDLVYEATGAARASFELLEVLGTNGVFVFTGVPGRKEPIEIDAPLLIRNLVLKNQLVIGTVNAGRDAFEAAIRDLADFKNRWPDALRSLITRKVPLDAWSDVLLGRPGGIKNVFALGAGR